MTSATYSFLRSIAVTLSHSNHDISLYMNQYYYLYINPDTAEFEWIPCRSPLMITAASIAQ